MVQKFRVPRKDPSIAPLFQDDSKWRLVREDQGPPLPRCARPHFVGTGVLDCPHRSYSACHPEPPCGVKDLFADRRNRELQWYRSSAFRGKILQSLRSLRMTESGGWCGRTKALPYRDVRGHSSWGRISSARTGKHQTFVLSIRFTRLLMRKRSRSMRALSRMRCTLPPGRL